MRSGVVERIPLVHLGQEERHRREHQHRKEQHALLRQPLPGKANRQAAENQRRKPQRHGHRAEHLIEHVAVHRLKRQQLIQARRVDRHEVVLPRLLDVAGEHVVKRLAAPERRDHHDHIHGRDGQQMAQLDLPAQPQRQKRRQEEHRLQLEGERHAKAEHAAHGVLAKGERQRQQAEARVDGVALAPVGAVEHDRWHNELEIQSLRKMV